MQIEQLAELSLNHTTLPEFALIQAPEGCNDCCCDLGCDTYD